MAYRDFARNHEELRVGATVMLEFRTLSSEFKDIRLCEITRETQTQWIIEYGGVVYRYNKKSLFRIGGGEPSWCQNASRILFYNEPEYLENNRKKNKHKLAEKFKYLNWSQFSLQFLCMLDELISKESNPPGD
jgi:hypothetical protein